MFGGFKYGIKRGVGEFGVRGKGFFNDLNDAIIS